MKKTSRAISILLVIILMLSPINALAKTSTSPFISGKYTHNSKYDSYKRYNGIDISYHNGDINFNKVKNDGVDFAIIRIGFRGYAKSGSLNADTKYKEYIKNAKKVGIKVGVYFYSQAISKPEAIAEAEFVLNLLNEEELDLPIFWDIEFAGGSGTSGRLYKAKLTKSEMTENALAFCNTIRSAGYESGVYANKSFLTCNMYPNKILKNDYQIWLAHYTKSTDYTGDYNIWQYAEKGSVKGISGNVDINFMYVTSAKQFEIEQIDNIEYTGSEIEPDIAVSYNSTVLTKDVDYKITYSDNIEIGCAKATITGLGNYSNFEEKNVYFNITTSTVNNINLTKRSTNSLTLQWDKVSKATGYQIQIYKNSCWNTVATTTDTSYTIKDLKCATRYSVRIRAYKKVNSIKYYSSYSTQVKFTTKPKQVQNISSTSNTKSLNLTWNKEGNPSGYYVYKYNAKTDEKSLYKKVTTNSVKVTGLTPNTKYSFIIVAYKVAENGTVYISKDSCVFTTYTKPIAPTLNKISSTSVKKIKVYWNKSTNISGYQIKWSTDKNFSQNCKTVTAKSNVTNSTITTSKSNKKYYVKIRTYRVVNGNKYYSPWSDTLYVKTK